MQAHPLIDEHTALGRNICTVNNLHENSRLVLVLFFALQLLLQEGPILGPMKLRDKLTT